MPVYSEIEAPTWQQEAPQPWMNQAACAGMDPEAFFPHRQDGAAAYAQPLRICSECPVKTQCQEWNDTFEGSSSGMWGIFGGETPQQRADRRLEDLQTELVIGKQCPRGHLIEDRTQILWNQRRPHCAHCWDHDHRHQVLMMPRPSRLIVGATCSRGHLIQSEDDIHVRPNGKRDCARCRRQSDTRRQTPNTRSTAQ